MILCDFKPRYRVLHLTNEIGTVFYGGVNVAVMELYRHRADDTGFLLFKMDNQDYVTQPDVAVIGNADIPRLASLDFDILVVHHYEYNQLVEPFVDNRIIVYAMHGMPTPEPTPRDFPFGGQEKTQQAYLWLCHQSNAIIFESKAEATKFSRICPQYADKAVLIPPGLTMPDSVTIAPARNKRNRIGHISRLDYRKGLLETMKAIRRLEDVELHVACNLADRRYLPLINDYLSATRINDRVHFHGFCVGDRKKAFYDHVDAIVVPSLWEPFGYTAIEPVLYGKTVIVANNSGPTEIVGQDYRYQFDPFSVSDQVGALRRFIDDPVEEVEAAFNGLAARLPMFDTKATIGKYETLMESLGG